MIQGIAMHDTNKDAPLDVYIPTEDFEKFKAEYEQLKMGSLTGRSLPPLNPEGWALDIANAKILELEAKITNLEHNEEQRGFDYMTYEKRIGQLEADLRWERITHDT